MFQILKERLFKIVKIIQWKQYKRKHLKPNIESINRALAFFSVSDQNLITLTKASRFRIITHSNDLSAFIQHLSIMVEKLALGESLIDKPILNQNAKVRLDWWLINGNKFRKLRPVEDLLLIVKLLNIVYEYRTENNDQYIKRVTRLELEAVYGLMVVYGQLIYEGGIRNAKK